MFKENSTKKLIDYIQTLPEKDQSLIVKRISGSKVAKGKKTAVKLKSKNGLKEMGFFLDKLGNKLPKNYKFNREESNER